VAFSSDAAYIPSGVGGARDVSDHPMPRSGLVTLAQDWSLRARGSAPHPSLLNSQRRFVPFPRGLLYFQSHRSRSLCQ